MNPAALLESTSDSRSTRREPAVDELRPLEIQVAKLSSDVEHIKTDVADIKVDLRRLDAKIDSVEQKLAAKIDTLRDGFSSTKIWALGLYLGLAGTLLLVMTKGFKWL